MSGPDELGVARAVHRRLRSANGFHAPTGPTPGGSIALPRIHAPLTATLSDVLAQRRSTYIFSPEAPTSGALAHLLWGSCGPQRSLILPDGTEHITLAAPTAGGLDSLDVYVVDLLGACVPAGVHRYQRRAHALVPVAGPPDRDAFARLLTQPQFVDTTGMFLILTARLADTLTKYPARHYRTVHVDTGVLVATIYLVATALGLGCCAVTGFFDDAVDALLHLDETAFTTAVIPFGRPTSRTR